MQDLLFRVIDALQSIVKNNVRIGRLTIHR